MREAAILASQSNVIARCQASPDPRALTIVSCEGTPIRSKRKTLAKPGRPFSIASAIAVLPEPEAPVRSTRGIIA
jgi:hypothetical protein